MAKKIGVVGVGAIGGILGGSLTMAGNSVTLIDQWPENVEAMKTRGLRISGTHGEHQIPVRALHLCEVSAVNERYDIVLLCTKSYDTRWAATFIAPYLKADGVVLSAQNSINDEWIAPIVGYNRVVACILILGGGMYGPAHVVRTNDPEGLAVTLGELHCRITPRLQELERIMAVVGKTRVTTNAWGERWAKLAINCMVNSMAGITGLSSAEVRRNERTRRILIRVAAEAVRVGQALGVAVEPIGGIPAQAFLDADSGAGMEDVETEMAHGATERGEGLPSLLQDLKKGRRTEIDYLNGYVVTKGVETGVATPINQALVTLVKRIESAGLQPDVSNLQSLEPYL